MTWYEVEHHGKVIRVPAARSASELWFHWRGETHVVSLNRGTKRGTASGSKTHPGVILAPMPGKVTKVLVNPRDPVKKGQSMIVMEAMKMEYTLEADRDGSVLELGATEGMQVGLGDVLARIGEP